MANVSVYNMQGQEVGNIDLNDAVFGGCSSAAGKQPPGHTEG